jgi:mRNA-degrading endonuclease RelE of RelBE toxin-antitoxin system
LASLQLKPAARESLKELPPEAQQEVLDALAEFEESQFDHPDVKAIRDNGEWIWRLKIKEQHTDHRAFIDYQEQVFTVLNIIHRDNAYQ